MCGMIVEVASTTQRRTDMDEDQMLGRLKDEQAAAWKDGFNTAKAAADAVFADLRAQVGALASLDPEYNDAIRDVLTLLDGGQR